MFKWVQVPVIEPLTPRNVYEHTPLDPYRYGEYPRFLRPIRDEHRTEWAKQYENGELVKPGDYPTGPKLTC